MGIVIYLQICYTTYTFKEFNMLEYDFNQLDDDFITLWSNFILYHDTSAIIEPLQRLAEKGQVNAIQCWYLLKKPEQQNQIIDSIVDGYYGDAFNEALAIANRTYDRTKPELLALKEKIAEYHEKGKKCALPRMDEELVVTEEIDNIYFRERYRLVEQFRATEYAKQLVNATELTELAATTTKSCLIWERLFEIYAANSLILNCNRISEKDHQSIRKALRKRLKVDPQNSVSKFTLAKSLSFFSDGKGFESINILKELTNRPLPSVANNSCEQEETILR